MKRIIVLGMILVLMFVSLGGCYWGYPDRGWGRGHDRDRGERHDRDRYERHDHDRGGRHDRDQDHDYERN